MSEPRVSRPVRNQGEIQFAMPEDSLPPEHPARVLGSVFEKLDLSPFLADARAFEGGSGRSTSCPRMLLTLWTYSISRGVGSAREIERLAEADPATAGSWATSVRAGARSRANGSITHDVLAHAAALIA